MCQNAVATLGSLMGAVEPDLLQLLTVLNVATTPQGQAAIAAYNVALQAVLNWVPGTSAADVIAVIKAFTAAFNAVIAVLPVVPPEVQLLVDIISAAIIVVIGTLTGNGPVPVAPTPSAGAASEDEIKHAWQASVATDTEKQVAKLVPGFKRSIWHSAAHQYENAWKKAVAAAVKVDPKYAALAVA